MNAVGHIVAALVFRAYNPGLVTAIVLFLPISIYGIRILQAAGCGSLAMQLTGLLSGIGIHIALIAYALVRSRTL